MGGLFRIVVEAQVESKRADTTNTPFVLGGANGLRGYAIGEFIGTTVLVGHIEVRTVPIGILSQRFGTVAFYDVGNAAPSFADLVPRNDVGLGLRWLVPQFNSSVIRVDWAVPLAGRRGHTGGYAGAFLGRLPAGFLTGRLLRAAPRSVDPGIARRRMPDEAPQLPFWVGVLGCHRHRRLR